MPTELRPPLLLLQLLLLFELEELLKLDNMLDYQSGIEARVVDHTSKTEQATRAINMLRQQEIFRTPKWNKRCPGIKDHFKKVSSDNDGHG